MINAMAENAVEALKACGDGEFRIAADGTWYHEGRPLARASLVRLFAGILHRDGDEGAWGDFWLQVPGEKVRVVVDDAPFVAVDMDIENEGPGQVVSFRTNVDKWVRLDGAHPLIVRATPEGPRPYLDLGSGFSALINRAVYYRLVDAAEEDRDAGPGIRSGGRFFPLTPVGEGR